VIADKGRSATSDDLRDVLLREYGEVSNNFRLLTDIRFRLLAFLPVAAGAAALVKPSMSDASTLVFSLFGLVVTVGLATYNARNDQLYDALVGRAAALERSLGLPDGAFANRPRAWYRPVRGRWRVDHRTGVAVIYYASTGLWLYGLVAAATGLVYQEAAGRRAPWYVLLALAVAVIALLGLGAWLIKRERRAAETRLRSLAAEAVKLAASKDVAALAGDETFRDLCAQLADAKDATIEARVAFLARLDVDDRARYVGGGADERVAAQTVAVLTDLPPQWLYDCATNRRLVVPAST
jgi:hypothetical protein